MFLYICNYQKYFKLLKIWNLKKILFKKFWREVSPNFIEEIEMRFTMCGMLTKNNIYNSEIYAKKKIIFEKYQIMEDFLITDFSY